MKILWILCLVILLKNASAEIKIISHRLPRAFEPIHYELILEPDLKTKTFIGRVEIDFKVATNAEDKKSLTNLVLNSYNLKIDDHNGIVLKENGNIVPIGPISHYPQSQKLIIVSKNPFQTKAQYWVSIDFTGVISTATNSSDNGGLILSSYKDAKGNLRNYIIANFFPVYARRAFPCFDEPYFKATFNLTISRPIDYNTISTIPLWRSFVGKDIKQNTVFWDLYRQTPVMAPSSLGFIISPLALMNNKNLNILAPTDSLANKISQEKYWNFTYQCSETVTSSTFKLPHLNFVFIPDLFQEVLTSWGIVYLRANKFFYTLNKLTEDSGIISQSVHESQRLQTLIAKAVMSQYYGDTVSPEFWDEVWLRNSISEFYGNFISPQYDKTWDVNQFISAYLRPLVLDYQWSSTNIQPIIANFDRKPIEQLTQSITQQQSSKGAAILYMIRNSLSSQVFDKPITEFLKNKQLNSGTSADLISLWQNQLKQHKHWLSQNLTVNDIVQTWLHNGGVPVLNIKRTNEQDIENQNLVISQFTRTSGEIQNSDKKQWYIPLTYTTAKDKNFQYKVAKLWFGPHTKKNTTQNELTLKGVIQPGDWVIFDTQATGVYRIKYDEENWNLITDQLKSDPSVIPVLNRAQLIDDTFSLASTGYVTYTESLTAGEYLTNETEFYPWFSALRWLTQMKLMLAQEKSLLDDFTDYISTSLENLYKHVGFYGKKDDKFTDVMLRAETLKWACDYQISDCIAHATTTMMQILNKKLTSPIKPDYLESVFCGGLQGANQSTWQKVYNLYKVKHDVTNEGYLLFALGCTRNTNTIDSYLKLIITEKLSKEEAFIIFHAVIKNQRNLDKTISFLNKNAVTIKNKYGEQLLSDMLIISGYFLTTNSQENEISKLSKQKIGHNPLVALNVTLNRIHSNILWLQNFAPELESYFNKYSTDKTPTGFAPTQEPQTTVKPNSGSFMSSSFNTILSLLTLLTLLYQL